MHSLPALATSWALAVQVVAGIMAVVGIFILARSPMVRGLTLSLGARLLHAGYSARVLAASRSATSSRLAAGTRIDAVIAANLSQRAAFWKLRDEMSAAQKPEGGSIKHEI